jgi:hypothetical protein
VHDNLYSGNWNHPYYNWDVAETTHTNKDGAVGYLIGQGNSCLGYTSSGYAVLKTCNYNDHTQWWFVDGDELMAEAGRPCTVNARQSRKWRAPGALYAPGTFGRSRTSPPVRCQPILSVKPTDRYV